MPTYDYRCPNGHTFELFQRMSDPPPGTCEVCGASPVERVLFAPAVHFKGSGFYATDYGRGKKRETAKDGEGAAASTDGTGKKSDEKAPTPASSSDGGGAGSSPSSS
jgi:putative FmdB family regulatory protein